MLDEHLDWTAQTESLIKKVNKDIYLLKRIKAFISQKVALVFYKSVIQSKFDYCDIVWGTMGLGLKNRIQKLQNHALRTVMGVNFEFPTEYLYRDLKMDKLETRRKKRTLYVMYKIAHEMLPHVICKLFPFKNNNYNLRHQQNNFQLPKVRTEFKKRSLSFNGVRSWNNLTNGIKGLGWDNFRRQVNNFITSNTR